MAKTRKKKTPTKTKKKKGLSMKKTHLGNKHLCYQCGCKFYDLKKPQPICPKCGVDQTDAPKKGVSQPPSQGAAVSTTGTTRTRARKSPGDSPLDAPSPFAEEDDDEKVDTVEEQDGLTVFDDDDFEDADLDDFTEDA